MRRPIIGITGSIDILSGDPLPGLGRDYVYRDYAESIIMTGGLPVIIPQIPEDMIPQAIAGIDGLVLSGGYDIAPDLYGEDPHRGIGYVMRSIDVFYMSIIGKALDASLPILGICKGLQALNVALGGTLYQDMEESGSPLAHEQRAQRGFPSHAVSILEGTLLHSILGGRQMVNSFHHQAIKDLAPGLVASAHASDGIIEAVEMPDRPVMAVQWHPEMMARAGGSETMLKIFKHFVDACMNH